MQSLANQTDVFASVAIVAALMMTRLGLVKRTLYLRRSSRPCPSCGRDYSGRVCSWCGRR